VCRTHPYSAKLWLTLTGAGVDSAGTAVPNCTRTLQTYLQTRGTALYTRRPEQPSQQAHTWGALDERRGVQLRCSQLSSEHGRAWRRPCAIGRRVCARGRQSARVRSGAAIAATALFTRRNNHSDRVVHAAPGAHRTQAHTWGTLDERTPWCAGARRSQPSSERERAHTHAHTHTHTPRRAVKVRRPQITAAARGAHLTARSCAWRRPCAIGRRVCARGRQSARVRSGAAIAATALCTRRNNHSDRVVHTAQLQQSQRPRCSHGATITATALFTRRNNHSTRTACEWCTSFLAWRWAASARRQAAAVMLTVQETASKQRERNCPTERPTARPTVGQSSA
jgi:hypothetical protein